MELGVVMTRQNFGFLCLLRVLVVVSGQGGRRSTRARGTLNEAKTQRRPYSARERVRGWGITFVVSLFLYLSFSRARIRHVEKMVKAKGAEG